MPCWGAEIAYAAYTGKGANVLREKGCVGAVTIHKALYTPISEVGNSAPVFVVNRNGLFAKADLIVIDECSMVNEKIAKDMLSLGKPILVTGDPGQLPPIDGPGYFMKQRPDVLLDEIHRQSRDNPIIQISQTIRRGGFPKAGRYGDTLITMPGRLPVDNVMTANQILAGRRLTCRTLTTAVRRLAGYGQALPGIGERVIAARNNHGRNLLNGEAFTVTDVKDTDEHAIRLKMLNAAGRERTFRCFTSPFESASGPTPNVASGIDLFEYGYVLTAHRAQGSQWSDVTVFDESAVFGASAKQWLYSAVTRASNRLTLIRS